MSGFACASHPERPRGRVLGFHAVAPKASVQAPPEKGKANHQVVEVVAEAFGLPGRRSS
jgi:uncharacterized protein YggU (UPF0235/DUF167 family)